MLIYLNKNGWEKWAWNNTCHTCCVWWRSAAEGG